MMRVDPTTWSAPPPAPPVEGAFYRVSFDMPPPPPGRSAIFFRARFRLDYGENLGQALAAPAGLPHVAGPSPGGRIKLWNDPGGLPVAFGAAAPRRYESIPAAAGQPTLDLTRGVAQFGEVEDHVACTLIARDRAKLNNGAHVVSASGLTLGVSEPWGRLVIGRNVLFDPNTWAVAHELVVRNASDLWGIAADVLRFAPDVAVLGPKLAAPSLPLLSPFPAAPVVACDTAASLVVDLGETMVLAPGTHGFIRVRDGATLRLSPGVYDVCSLLTGRGARILFDDGAGSTLNVAGNFRVGPGSTFEAPAGTPPPVVDVAGTRVIVGPGARVGAIITAPEATLTLGRSATFGGSFLVRRMGTHHSVTCACVLP